jgi:hypothetical protein
MELNFKHRLLAGTMLAGGALFGICGVPAVAQAATCTTIVDNTGSGNHLRLHRPDHSRQQLSRNHQSFSKTSYDA